VETEPGNMLEKYSQWIQVCMAIGVLVGLVLVVTELRQSRTLIRAEMAGENYDNVIQQNIALLGEDPSNILAKACKAENLEASELLVLDQFFLMKLNTSIRLWTIQSIAGFDAESYGYGIKASLIWIALLPQGESWWEEARKHRPREFVRLADSFLPTVRGSCLGLLELMQPLTEDSLKFPS